MLYAIDSFRTIVWACNHILKYKPHASELIYQCLMTSILTNYGRPFHRNYGVGKLNLAIVPNEYRHLHNQLMHERDKIHAHTDADGILTRIGNANQVRLLRLENGFIWATSTFLPYDYSDIQNIRDLSQSLIDKLDQLTDEYEQQCLPEIKKLDPGEYTLNTDENEVIRVNTHLIRMKTKQLCSQRRVAYFHPIVN